MSNLARQPRSFRALHSAALALSLATTLGACATLDTSRPNATFWGYSQSPPPPSGPTFWGYPSTQATPPAEPTFWGFVAMPAAQTGPTFWGFSTAPAEQSAPSVPSTSLPAPVATKR